MPNGAFSNPFETFELTSRDDWIGSDHVDAPKKPECPLLTIRVSKLPVLISVPLVVA